MPGAAKAIQNWFRRLWAGRFLAATAGRWGAGCVEVVIGTA